MKKRLVSVFVFALTVSAGAAFVLYQLISTRVTAGAANTKTVTKTVFVAAKDLQPGALVTEHDIEKQEFVKVPEGAITKKEDILNRGVINPIHRDAPFFEGTLAARGEGAGFATIIPTGMRALAVKVNEVVGVAGFAVAGMHVDVLVAGTPPSAGQTMGPISRTLLQNITVLSAGQNYQKDAEGKPVMVQVVNLLVTPAQAEILNLATDQRIQLILRNPNDQAITETPGAATQNLFEGSAIRISRVSVTEGASSASSATGAVKPRKRADAPIVAASQPAVGIPAPVPAVPRTSIIEVLAGSVRSQVIVGREKDKNMEPAQ